VSALGTARYHRRVAGVHHVQPLERLDAELEGVDRSGVVRGRADRVRAEPAPRSMTGALVVGGADDRHVRPAAGKARVVEVRQLLERRKADVRRQVALQELVIRVGVDGRILVIGAAVAANLVGHRSSAGRSCSQGTSAVAVRSRLVQPKRARS
jgi:hypothetical protein